MINYELHAVSVGVQKMVAWCCSDTWIENHLYSYKLLTPVISKWNIHLGWITKKSKHSGQLALTGHQHLYTGWERRDKAWRSGGVPAGVLLYPGVGVVVRELRWLGQPGNEWIHGDEQHSACSQTSFWFTDVSAYTYSKGKKKTKPKDPWKKK